MKKKFKIIDTSSGEKIKLGEGRAQAIPVRNPFVSFG